MTRIRIVLLLVATLALSLTGMSTASAEAPAPPRTPEISYVAPVAYVHRGVVTVAGVYRCWGDSDAYHLWVSAKQGGPDPTAEGSSSTVQAWYDTNVSRDVEVVCNGRWQVRTVTLGKNVTDFTGRPLTDIRNGRAWVQFCLVAPDGSLASKNRWAHVVGAR